MRATALPLAHSDSELSVCAPGEAMLHKLCGEGKQQAGFGNGEQAGGSFRVNEVGDAYSSLEAMVIA